MKQKPANLKNQVSYMMGLKKRVYEFRLVEIISENELREHFSFLFPYYSTEE